MYLTHVIDLIEGTKGRTLDGLNFTVVLERPNAVVCESDKDLFVIERNPKCINTGTDTYIYITGEQEDSEQKIVHATNLESMITHIAVEKDGNIRAICGNRWNVGSTLIQDTIVNCESCRKLEETRSNTR